MINKHKYSILIVDDEENILDIYSHALAQVEYKIIQAKDGKEAYDLLVNKKLKIDLILLDIIMPRMDGFDLLKKIKKDKQLMSIPVIILSNLNRTEDVDEAKYLGAVDFLVKVKHGPLDLIKKVNTFFKDKKNEEKKFF
jgi:PleD family two-component response regulator